MRLVSPIERIVHFNGHGIRFTPGKIVNITDPDLAAACIAAGAIEHKDLPPAQSAKVIEPDTPRMPKSAPAKK